MNQCMNKIEFIKKMHHYFFLTMAFIYLVVKAIPAFGGNFEQQENNKDI